MYRDLKPGPTEHDAACSRSCDTDVQSAGARFPTARGQCCGYVPLATSLQSSLWYRGLERVVRTDLHGD